MSDPYEFDLALSFAGEDREFVEDVATELKAAHVKYFLDSDYLAEMWGEDLVEFVLQPDVGHALGQEAASLHPPPQGMG